MKQAIKKALERHPAWLNRARALQFRLQGQARDKHRVVFRFKAKGPRQGAVLVSLITEPFLRPPGTPISHDHTHHWETVEIVEVWREMGFDVDVIRWTNKTFLPDKPYDIVIDTRANLERLAPYLPETCLKVMHIDTGYWEYHNAAQLRRIAAIRERRGAVIAPSKILPPNRGIQTADCATMLGNAWTASTYAFANKPILRVPISTTDMFDWPEGKDFAAARRRFLWFGSAGLVHKGLDLVLEAFAQMPECRLVVAGPVKNEQDFPEVYRKELYETPNIEVLDWVDLHSPEWLTLARTCGGVVYPSCSEGGGGSVITCMHAGILPVVTDSASVDIEDFGVPIAGETVDDVIAAVRTVAAMAPEELERRTRAAWEFARAHHTRDIHAAAYRAAAKALLDIRRSRG